VKKKKIRIIALALSMPLAILLLTASMFNALQQPEKLDIAVEPVYEVNYNNYYEDTRLDYRGGQMAWQTGFKLTLVKDDGTTSSLSGIPSAFQLLDDRVLYMKNDDLMCRMLSGGTDDFLSSGVSSFIALEDSVLYLSNGALRKHQWDDQDLVLGYGIEEFFYHHNKIYVITDKGWLVELQSDGTWREIYDFNQTDFTLPMTLKFQKNCAIYQFSNELCFISLTDGSTKTVPLAETKSVDNHISYICDDQRLFVSFLTAEAEDSTDTAAEDSPETNKDDGVWKITGVSGEKNKLCDETFEQLYLFENNRLFGVRGNDLFQIDTETGVVTQISE